MPCFSDFHKKKNELAIIQRKGSAGAGAIFTSLVITLIIKSSGRRHALRGKGAADILLRPEGVNSDQLLITFNDSPSNPS